MLRPVARRGASGHRASRATVGQSILVTLPGRAVGSAENRRSRLGNRSGTCREPAPCDIYIYIVLVMSGRVAHSALHRMPIKGRSHFTVPNAGAA